MLVYYLIVLQDTGEWFGGYTEHHGKFIRCKAGDFKRALILEDKARLDDCCATINTVYPKYTAKVKQIRISYEVEDV